MRPDLILLAAVLLVSAGILAAGCVSPGGDGTQPPPTETVTIPPETGTLTPTEPVTFPTATETLPATVATAAGGQTGY